MRIGFISLIILLISIASSACMQQPGAVTAPGNVPPASKTVPASSIGSNQPTLPYVIVDTGQERCYDNSKEIAAPKPGEAFYGQDAQHAGNKPAYKDNGNGTITDLNTGLMWQKDPGSKVNYSQAVAGAKTLNLAGYSDWRLPTIKELYSLILFSGTDPSGPEASKPVPFLDTNYFKFEYGNTSTGERIIDAQYWSSTEYLGRTMLNAAATAFGVNFADGRIKGYPRDSGARGEPMKEFVRYVRGNTAYGVNNFKDNGDGAITDKATGLMWAKADSGKGMDWEDALAWVQQKNREKYLGHSDWRLPDAKELQSIVDYKRAPDVTGSAAISTFFEISSISNEGGKTDYPFFWTSTTHISTMQAQSGRAAAYVAFGRALGFMLPGGMQSPVGPSGQQPVPGGPMPGSNQPADNYQLVDVHGAGAQRSDPKEGNPADYPHGRGPQGDNIRINNYVRCVRNSG
jgi:hypothetical protein